MKNIAVLLDIPLQPVKQGTNIDVLLSIQSDTVGFTNTNTVLIFDPTVIELQEIKPYSCKIDAPEKTFPSGIVPLNISVGASMPGVVKCADLFFRVIGTAGMSTEITVDLMNIKFTDGTNSGGVTGKKRVIVTPLPLQPLTVNLPNAIVGRHYGYQLTAKGGVPPYKWLPLGMPDFFELSESGFLSGTPRELGLTGFEIELRDSNNPPGSYSDGYALQVVTEPMSLPANKPEPCPLGMIYYHRLEVYGGIPPFKWSIVSGRLPQGITLSEQGMLSGTSTEVGVFQLRAAVVDSAGTRCEEDISINARALFLQSVCGKIQGAKSILALPNLVFQPYQLTFDLDFEFGPINNQSLGLKTVISVGNTEIFNDILTSGKKSMPTYLLPGGPQIISIKIDQSETNRGCLKFREILIVPGQSHKKPDARPVKITFIELDKTTNAIISETKKVLPGEELTVEAVMPGSSDDLLVLADNRLEILTVSNKKVVSAKALSLSGVETLKSVTKGCSGGHLLMAGMQNKSKLGLLRQEADGSWSVKTINTAKTYSAFAPVYDTDSSVLKAVLGTKDGIEVLDVETGIMTGPYTTYGAAGSEEISDICILDTEKSGIDLVAANKFGNNIAMLSGYDYQSVKVKSTAIELGQPVKIDAKTIGPYGKTYISVSSKTKNAVKIFELNANDKLKELQEAMVGACPSDMIIADFCGDGKPVVLTADTLSNTVSVTALCEKNTTTADMYYGPEKPASLAVAREADGRLRVLALGKASGEIVSWISHTYCPMCQVTPHIVERKQQKKGQACIFNKAVLIGNSGISDLTIQDIRFCGRWSQLFVFMDLPDFPMKLKPDKALSLDFIFTGYNSAGIFGCSIEIITNDPLNPVIFVPISITVDNVDAPIQPYPQVLYMGNILQGTQNIARRWSICNVLNKNAFIEKIWITGKNREVYDYSPHTEPVYLTGWEYDVRINANTNKCGTFNSAVIADINVNNEKYSIAAALSMSVYRPDPKINLASALNLGPVLFGKYAEAGIPGSNDGFSELIISAAEFSGPDADQFQVVTPLPFKAQPDEYMHNLKIRYTPTRYKSCSSVLTFTTNDPKQSKASINVHGACLSSQIALIPDKLEFGFNLNFDFDQYKQYLNKWATFYNWGAGAAEIKVKNIVGKFELVNSAFPVANMYGSLDFSVLPIKSTVAGVETGYIEFETNDPRHPVIKLELKAAWYV